ncbi:2'-5' RNA ligase family protein [Fodinibius sp. Rm-B-1B1-1]|uniref:2'-5' RNA ligase family protein n=1 Tax=Fodinibius alkaliphilus TaxID=3140241 RepID=UPI00315A1CA0
MKKKSTYSIWLEPTGDVAYNYKQRIKKLSEKHGTPKFSPHITLVGGLEATNAELVPLIDTLASSVTPFSLTLTKAGYLNTFYQALFIHIAENEQLLNLRKNACQLFDCNKNEEYMPHLSLLYGELSSKEKEVILNNIGREFYTDFMVKKVVLMNTDGTPPRWRKVHTSMFKQAE